MVQLSKIHFFFSADLLKRTSAKSRDFNNLAISPPDVTAAYPAIYISDKGPLPPALRLSSPIRGAVQEESSLSLCVLYRLMRKPLGPRSLLTRVMLIGTSGSALMWVCGGGLLFTTSGLGRSLQRVAAQGMLGNVGCHRLSL